MPQKITHGAFVHAGSRLKTFPALLPGGIGQVEVAGDGRVGDPALVHVESGHQVRIVEAGLPAFFGIGQDDAQTRVAAAGGRSRKLARHDDVCLREPEDMFRRERACRGACALPLEVANALLMADRRERITTDFRNAALQDLGALPITLDAETTARTWHDTVRLAETHRLTMYDAAYLELAQRRTLPLATLDAELGTAARALGIALLGG